MKEFLRLVGFIVAIFIFAVVVDRIPMLKSLDGYLQGHPQPWTATTLVTAGLGLGLLVLVWINWGIRTGRRMDQGEAQAFMRNSSSTPPLHRNLQGKAAGITSPEREASFRTIKEGLINGTWRTDPTLQTFLLGLAGAMLLVLGGFGYIFVIGPPTVKVLCAGIVIYAFARTAWGFWKA